MKYTFIGMVRNLGERRTLNNVSLRIREKRRDNPQTYSYSELLGGCHGGNESIIALMKKGYPY